MEAFDPDKSLTAEQKLFSVKKKLNQIKRRLIAANIEDTESNTPDERVLNMRQLRGVIRATIGEIEKLL